MSRQVKKVNISGKEDKSNKVSSWSNTTTDTNYPSEKLVKDSLDGKANSTHNHTKSQITDFPTSMTPTSHTHGNLQNNGQVGSTAQASKNVVTDSSGKITTEDKPTIPSASSTTPSADTTNGSVGNGTTWARSNHTHPKSSLYAESSHTHNKSQISDFPTIPSKTSELTNDSGFLTSHQDISGKIDTAGTGLSKSGTTLNHSNSMTALTTASFKKVKYDSQGHITGTSDVSASDLPTHTHSQYLTEHQDLSDYVTNDDSRLSDARTPTSHTHITSQITDFPTLPTASSTVPSADTQNGSYGSGTSYARSNHTHPKSTLYAESSHTHSQYLTSHQDITGKEDSSNKVSSWNSTTNNTRYPTEKLVKDSLDGKSDNGHTHSQYLTSHQDITGKENTSNKVTSISSSSTDTEYPSAKCVYDENDDLWNYVENLDYTQIGGNLVVSDEGIQAQGLEQIINQIISRLMAKSNTDHTHSGYASSSHTHGTWTSQTVATYGTLYVNTAIRMCELRYVRTFGSASANTFYEWHTGAIPSGYRPSSQVGGAINQGGTLYVNASGDIGGLFSRSWSSSTNVIGTCMWHY